MLKLNRINLKLHEFENKYIKTGNKNKDISSTSDDSISSYEISSPKKLPETVESPKQFTTDKIEHARSIPENVISAPKSILTNGHLKEPIVNDLQKLSKKSNISRPVRSQTFDVLENIKLISLEDSPDDDVRDVDIPSEKSHHSQDGSTLNSRAGFSPTKMISKRYQEDDIKILSDISSMETVPEVELSSNDRLGSDIVEDLASPGSDIPEDITEINTNGSESKDKSVQEGKSTGGSSGSVTSKYNYSSKFENLSDASERGKENLRKTNLKKVSNKGADKAKARRTLSEDKDATFADSSELDQTPSLNKNQDSEKSNDALESKRSFDGESSNSGSENQSKTPENGSQEKISETTPVSFDSNVQQSDFKQGSDKIESTGESTIKSTGKITKPKLYEKDNRSEKIEYVDAVQNSSPAPDDISLKASEQGLKKHKTHLKKSKGILKVSDSGLNNCYYVDSKSKATTFGVSCKEPKTKTNLEETEPAKGFKKTHGNEIDGGEQSRRAILKRIKNDISSDFEINQKDESSPKILNNFDGGKGPTDCKSVNTQTSPKISFKEDFSANRPFFGENFGTSKKNLCSCCTHYDWNSVDLIALKTNHTNLETAMNHLLKGQLNFIRKMVDKQNQSHTLNRRIVQQMKNMSKTK